MSIVPTERIASRIFLIRDQKVMLANDLAELYGVTTSALNQQVRRNMERFPEDFAFALTVDEYRSLQSQIVMANRGRGGRRRPPMGVYPARKAADLDLIVALRAD